MRKQTRSVAYGGLLGAFIILLLSAVMWLPTADIALLSLTSLAIAVAVIELGHKMGWVLYFATAALAVAWPGLAFTWPYLFFFGPYPLLRALIDSRWSPRIAQFVRIGMGLILSFFSIFIFGLSAIKSLFEQTGRWIWFLIPVGATALLVIYDLALGMLIHLYSKRSRHS